MDTNEHNRRLQMFDFERPPMRKVRSLIMLKAPKKIIEGAMSDLTESEKKTIKDWQEFKDLQNLPDPPCITIQDRSRRPPIRLMRIRPDRELKTLRAQYDGPGAFHITTITMTDSHLMIPEAVADVLNEKYLGKVAKKMSDLYQLVIIREQEPPAEAIIEVEPDNFYEQLADDLRMQCALTDNTEVVAKFLKERLG